MTDPIITPTLPEDRTVPLAKIEHERIHRESIIAQARAWKRRATQLQEENEHLTGQLDRLARVTMEADHERTVARQGSLEAEAGRDEARAALAAAGAELEQAKAQQLSAQLTSLEAMLVFAQTIRDLRGEAAGQSEAIRYLQNRMGEMNEMLDRVVAESNTDRATAASLERELEKARESEQLARTAGRKAQDEALAMAQASDARLKSELEREAAKSDIAWNRERDKVAQLVTAADNLLAQLPESPDQLVTIHVDGPLARAFRDLGTVVRRVRPNISKDDCA